MPGASRRWFRSSGKAGRQVIESVREHASEATTPLAVRQASPMVFQGDQAPSPSCACWPFHSASAVPGW